MDCIYLGQKVRADGITSLVMCIDDMTLAVRKTTGALPNVFALTESNIHLSPIIELRHVVRDAKIIWRPV